MGQIEIEARFLNINPEELKYRLQQVGAKDLGEDFLTEVIFYDQGLEWQKSKDTMVRLRQNKKGVSLTYKHVHNADKVDGTTEIDLTVNDLGTSQLFLERVGLIAFRRQEKRRHSFALGEVMIDIDTWPSIPPYVELEGPSEELIKQVAATLGFDYSQAVFGNAGKTIEKYYNIDIAPLRFFTFEKIG